MRDLTLPAPSRPSSLSSLVRGALVLGATLGGIGAVHAGPKDFAIYTTRLGGDAETAQPYVNKFAGNLETALGWAKGGASGTFLPTKKEAQGFIEQKKPGFGVLEPALFLELRKTQSLEALASVESADLNTPKLNVIVKNAAYKTLDDLKGKTVMTTLADSPRYLDRVVLGGTGSAETRFTLKQTGNVMKGIRAVLRGDADATLVDDEQLALAKKMEGGADLRVVHTSGALPPLMVVSFGTSLSDKEKKDLTKALTGLCGGAGGDVCKEMHIQKFVPMSPAGLTAAQTKFEKP